MKKAIICHAASALLMAACSPAEQAIHEGPGGKADCADCSDASELRFVDWESRWAVSQLVAADELSMHRVGTYSHEAFNAGEFKQEMVDEDSLARQCDSRSYSVSIDSGVSMFREFADKAEAVEIIDSYRAAIMDKIVADPDNRAVFATVWDEGDGGDASNCAYADFFVFRNDHTVVNFFFDYRSGWVQPLPAMESPVIRYPSAADAELIGRMQMYGGNGGSALGTYDPAAVDEDRVLAQIAAYDLNMGSCADRRLEVTPEGVADAFDAFASDEDLSPFNSNDWVETADPAADHHDLRAALLAEDNVQVISSTWKDNSTDYSEGCLYFDFYALRADGTAWRFTVSHTD